MLDGNVEVGGDGVDDLLGSGVERGVDLRHPLAGDVDPQVTGDGNEQGAAGAGFGVEDHNRVGALAVVAGGAAEGALVVGVLDERAAVGADEEVVPAVGGG